MTIAQRVRNGAEWLDENRPGWVNEIDLGRLELTSPCLCILGQLWGNYWSAVREMSLGDTAPLGFEVRPHLLVADRVAEVDDLEGEWRRVIEARRAEQ